MSEAARSNTRWEAWLLASRPKTLPAAAAPVILGTALAVKDGAFQPLAATAAMAGALLIQIGTNLANDYFDFKKGADTAERLGPVRVTQAGLLPPESVARGMWITFGLAALIGVYLIASAGWPVLVIGLFSILAGIAYTGGPFPLGYNGLGDLFVFLFFGLVAVGGTYFVQAHTVTAHVLAASVPVGLLATGILVVNNLRDLETDRAAGKRTLAVRIGPVGTRWQYTLLLAASFLIPAFFVLVEASSPWVLLTWLRLPKAIALVKAVHTESGRALNRTLAGTGQLELEYALLFSFGLVMPLVLFN